MSSRSKRAAEVVLRRALKRVPAVVAVRPKPEPKPPRKKKNKRAQRDEKSKRRRDARALRCALARRDGAVVPGPDGVMVLRLACTWCRKPEKPGRLLTVDHVVPLSRGGTDDVENCVLACLVCNQQRADMLGPPGFWDDFDAMLKRVAANTRADLGALEALRPLWQASESRTVTAAKTGDGWVCVGPEAVVPVESER